MVKRKKVEICKSNNTCLNGKSDATTPVGQEESEKENESAVRALIFPG